MKFLSGLANSDYLGFVFFAVFFLASWAQGLDPLALSTTIVGPVLIDCLR